MKLYFAMDISKGSVVLGSKGERRKYKPVGSPKTILEKFNPKNIYIADLDKIEGTGSNLQLIEEIAKSYEVIADLGFRKPDEVRDFNFIPIIATETFDLRKIYDVEGEYYVSLDFKSNSLLGEVDLDSALEILNTLKTVVIVLMIDRVGTLDANFEIVEYILSRSDNPVIAGGGIRNVKDLEKLKDMGCFGAIIATAIYRGLIPLNYIKCGRI
jgi:phosphoribosylformimino-5-aminoimidazole carboxamide ribotide isomerase